MLPISFHLVPLVAVGPVRFGMTREEATAALQGHAAPPSPSRTEREQDLFDGALRLFFDENGRVEFIELSRDDAVQALYADVDVLNLPASEAVALIAQDAAFTQDTPEGHQYEFPKLQLALWRPYVSDDPHDEDGWFFSTIGLGRDGYFSSTPPQSR